LCVSLQDVAESGFSRVTQRESKLQRRDYRFIQGETVFLLSFVIKKTQNKTTNEHFPFTVRKEGS